PSEPETGRAPWCGHAAGRVMVIRQTAVNCEWRSFLPRIGAACCAQSKRLARGMSFNKFPPKPKYDPDTGPVYLYGLHTVRAALANPLREKKALLATPNGL